MIKFFLHLIIGSLKSGNFFRNIYHLIKYKKITFKDLRIKITQIFFQRNLLKTVKKSGVDFYYSDKYLMSQTKHIEIDKFLDAVDFKNKNYFSEPIYDIDKSHLIYEADKICNHVFNLLGSGDIKINYSAEFAGIEGIKFEHTTTLNPNTNLLKDNYEPIDWFVDFKSGYRWEKDKFYRDINSSGNPNGVDIKVPWELSRCQHFGILGEAYRSTKNDKYAHEIKNQIIDWINNNLYGYGPNWVCAMDVGIRISNWLVGLELIKDSSVLRDDYFLKLLSKSIHHHQDYLLNNLEWRSSLTSNHYLSDIVGLFFISSYFPYFSNSNSIRKRFAKEIENEIFKQTYIDGMNSEGSTSYHRLVIELFAYSAYIDSNKKIFSEDFRNRLFKMFKFSAKTIKNDGTVPQIGDNDSGIFLKFNNKNLSNHSYLFDLAYTIFDESKKYELQEDLKAKYSIFKNAGVYVFRDNNIYFLIYNGPNGQKGNGGHAHNDKLSFILNYKGEDIFYDPGTYLYTPFPEQRNLFRSTKSHNTVMIGDYEQNQFIDHYLFGMVEDCFDLKSNFVSKDDGFIFSGTHNGYQRLGKDFLHLRSIEYSKNHNKIKIIDSFKDSNIEKSFYLIMNKNSFKGINNKKLFFKYGSVEFKNFINIKYESFFYSPNYGIKNDSAIRIIVNFKDSIETVINIEE